MSHDLGFFSPKQGATTSEVRAAYLSSCEGENISWPSSGALTSFISALEKEYPCIDTLNDDEVDESPWSCGFDKEEGHIIVSMVFSRASEVGNFVWGLLERHELIVFDPQADKAYIGNNELPEIQESNKWWQFWK
ncbi:hypothetical protein MAMP_01881 [Methylophaga aminisulfidivorans MP]|uniref:Uncharacterized protein n=1 Tax=Methylophaga aminisulfidivorans MP TaxID=1026882 RepID=F5SWZ4_9GAMM|nr:hypothetical protein [Methylophaga aminisulfidivorans]EGL54887.1 hypothetical protein MAMP_01881 [Methylophaga aminisulfidivorans MP]